MLRSVLLMGSALSLSLAVLAPSAARAANQDKKVELKVELPKPAFKGTPKNAPPGANLEPARKGAREPLMVPAGVKLLSAGKPVTSSDSEPIIGKLKFVTDGDAEAAEGSYVELGPGLQWVQVDLGAEHELHAVLLWHYHISARIYNDVIVQVSNDKDFVKGVTTIFNNDHDNSAGIALGEAKEYWETYEGKLIDAGGAKGRYIRAYSKGNSEDDQNHYTELQVFGK